MTERRPVTILIADDDKNVVELLTAFVAACGHEVVDGVTAGGLAVLQSCTRHNPDVVLMDIIMPRLNGFTVCQQIVSRNPAVKVLLMSGRVEQDYPSVAKCGAVGYLHKPMRFDELREALDKVLGSQGPAEAGPPPVVVASEEVAA